ncbi:hypothetical protein HGP28_18330 [Vibrio sp. SM6]|uniref:Phthiocerol/phthiodiolone dimycocerosyl transferase n=1 Tax=Vibrio agarilyticus TaxID=2726741 RepID=A0A7X8TTZ2_9VIBR|nr:hypothetical protein [Vibrio agarilyticus]NLS14819.1 hypothetical protein [Vibrio agarilyticus]
MKLDLRSLGATERFFAEMTPSAGMNVVTLAWLSGPLDLLSLPSKIARLQQQLVLLQVGISQDSKDTWRFVMANTSAVPVATYVVPQQQFTTTVEHEMATQSQLAFSVNAPLWRLSLISSGREKHALILTLHHTICDGRSAVTLLDTIICALNNSPALAVLSQPYPLNPSLNTLLESVESDFAQVPFAPRQSSEALQSWIDTHNDTTGLRYNQLGFITFTPEQTSQMLAACREHQLTLNALLYGALAQCLYRAAKPKQTEMTLGGNIDLRALFALPEPDNPFGCFAGMCSILLRHAPQTSLWALAEQAKVAFDAAISSGSYINTGKDAWWEAARNIENPGASHDQGRFSPGHLSNLGRITLKSAHQPLHITHLFMTASQHFVGATYWLGAACVNERLCLTLNTSAPGISATAHEQFKRDLKQVLLSALDREALPLEVV